MAGNRAYDSRRFWALARLAQDRLLERYSRLLDPEQVFALMFVIDFEAYGQHGTSITGATWAKMPDGWSCAMTWPG